MKPVFNLRFNLLTFCLILSISLFSQSNYQFKKGLVLPSSHRYGREALYTDQLAYLLNKGELKTPQEGQAVFMDNNENVTMWGGIDADSTGRFRGRPLAAGYLYLTYTSGKEQHALLSMTNNSMVYVNGEPRVGDLYGSANVVLPVKLKKGLNEFFVRGGRFSAYGGMTAELILDTKPAFLNVDDPILPIVVIGNNNSNLRAAVIVVNNTDKSKKGLRLKSILEGKEMWTDLPEIPPMTLRKVGFQLDASALKQKGKFACNLDLVQSGKVIDNREIKIETALPGEDYSETFISEIDGSTQYYSVSPEKGTATAHPALVLSVHGAGVEAINQARAYQSKEMGPVVCPTNRRPRGFNWEDWGRMDAMEVLEIAKKKFQPDLSRIYLTGHSMGGHGTWYLGATYAGQWAAIAPCAGYPTLSSYGSADGAIPIFGASETENRLLRASNPSNVFELIRNYNSGGVYIHHGDSDKTVSVEYARLMHRKLSEFSKDISYYEYPGGSHWFSDESVDWKPLFDYFTYHTILADTSVFNIHFTTANPAISSRHYWTNIIQQEECLKYSRLILSKSQNRKFISGTTENIALMSFSLSDLKSGDRLKLVLDNQQVIDYQVKSGNDILYLQKTEGQWSVGSPNTDRAKGVVRNGTFKEPFNHRMVFVYGTKGTKEENAWAYSKARYDAECWYYRGNGAVDIIPDKEFKAADYPDRGVILFGNTETNLAWKALLSDCPIQVNNRSIQVDKKRYEGVNLSAYFMWPRADSKIAGVAVVSGTGIEGMRATDANQYFAGGSGFPDYMIFTSDLMIKGSGSILSAGFYDNNWSIK